METTTLVYHIDGAGGNVIVRNADTLDDIHCYIIMKHGLLDIYTMFYSRKKSKNRLVQILNHDETLADLKLNPLDHLWFKEICNLDISQCTRDRYIKKIKECDRMIARDNQNIYQTRSKWCLRNRAETINLYKEYIRKKRKEKRDTLEKLLELVGIEEYKKIFGKLPELNEYPYSQTPL